MNWFWKLIHRLVYISYTPANLALGAEKADTLRKVIKCNAHLLLRSIHTPSFGAYVFALLVKNDYLVSNERAAWMIVLHEQERKLELRCYTVNESPTRLLFSTLGQCEIPTEYLISVHQALKSAIKEAIYRYGGTGAALQPFVQIAKYKF